MKKIVIVGVGNILFGDDGYGSRLAEALEKCSSGAEIIDAGADSLKILAELEEYDVIVFLDVCSHELFDSYENYIVLKISKDNVEEISLQKVIREIIDPHVTPPVQIAALLYGTGRFDGIVYILCAKPRTIEFGKSLSREIISSTAEIVNALISILENEGGMIKIDMKCLNNRLHANFF